MLESTLIFDRIKILQKRKGGFVMLKIINTSGQIDDLFDKGAFSRDKWREYINSIYEDSFYLFEDEVEEYIASGKYTFDQDF